MHSLKTDNVDCSICGSTKSREIGRSMDYEYNCCSNEFLFVECFQCGLIYMKNRPSLSSLPVIYSGEYMAFNYAEYLGGIINWARSIQQKSKIKPVARYAKAGATIVDVGCAGGELLYLMKRYGDASWQLIGVDIAEQSMENLRRHGIDGHQDRFEVMKWEGPAPQVIIMNQMIEHVGNPAAFVAKAFEILAPGGSLIVETPCLEGWDFHLFNKRYWGGWHTPRHWNLFKKSTLRNLLVQNQFTVTEVTYILSPYSWLQSLRFYVSDRLKMPRLSKIFELNVLPAVVMACLVDIVQKMVTGKTSNIRMVGRKAGGEQQ